MTVAETMIRGVQNLSLREQADVARCVHRLNANAQDVREEVLRSTHGALDEEEGLAFERAMKGSRFLEPNG